jgi:regulator of protease activity HflC (stomatin/prohibitin superfamily)
VFILGIILLLIAVICALVAVGAKVAKADSEIVTGWSVGAGVALLVTVIVIVIASFNSVGTQNIGVVTSFGRPSGELDNGVHWLAPWKGVVQIDGAIQTQTFENSACIQVRIGEQQTACADVILRWRIEPSAADQLFRNYHGGSSVIADVSGSLVHPDFVAALNASLDTYNPVAATAAAPGTAANPHLSVISNQVAAQMRGDLKGQIGVLSVVIPRLVYQGSVQNRINQEDQQVAQTIIANEAIKTAQAQATANQTLSKSVSNNPNVLVAQCMNVLEALQKSGGAIPVGFSCWPGSSVGVIAGK